MKKCPFRRSVIREICKVITFFSLATAAFLLVCSLLSFKYDGGDYSFKTFYRQEKNSVDLLVIGSSHAYEHIHTGVLYDDYGIAAFNLSSSAQPLWVSYHYLVEALKTQTPSLVVLEGYSLASSDALVEDSWNVRSTFGMKRSLNWLQNLKTSVLPEKFWMHFFRFPYYHNRFESDLTRSDYLPYKGQSFYKDWKGYLSYYAQIPYDVPEALGTSAIYPLAPKVETYYRKFIELCLSRNIPVHIVVSPGSYSEQSLGHFNRGREIAQEYGVPFTNYNEPEMLRLIEFDYATDMSTDNHLNYRGAIKMSRELGKRLTSMHSLPDRRGDPRYASWERSAAYHNRDVLTPQLKAENDADAYFSLLAEHTDYSIIASVTGYCRDYFEQITAWLASIGVHDIYFDHEMNGTWILRDGQTVLRVSLDMYPHYYELGNHVFTFSTSPDFCTIDQESARRVDKGLNLIVYDHLTQTVVDVVGFDALDNFAAVR